MKTRSICIDARMLHASGIGIYLKNLIPLLNDNYDLILIGKREEIGRYNWSDKVGIIEVKSGYYTIQEQLELPVKIPKCDLFWSPHYNVPILLIRAKKRLVTIHDVFHLAFFNKLTLPQKIYAKIVIKAATSLSDRIITVSEFSKSEIVKYTGTDPDKIKAIYNGIDTKKFRPILDQEFLKNVKQKHNLPEKFWLFVGNVKPHKNLQGLIKAFGFLKKEKMLEEYHLVIVGKKEGFITNDTVIEKLIEESLLEPFIKFTGFVTDDDLPAIYNLASALVFPSLYEGFGFPPLEAMACGCPVAASNAASLLEVCGDAVVYFDPKNNEDIAQKIYDLINNECLIIKLKEKGFQRVAQFTWDICAQETSNVINELISGHS